MLTNAETLAREAQSETGMGRWEDKVVKNRLVASKTAGTEALVPEAKSGDDGLMLMERAPFGVIGAITPCTNPTSTIICNTIGMVAAGNSVVFCVHPSAKRVSTHNVALLNEAIIRAGGPPNLVTTIAEPSIAAAQTLMKHPGIRLLVVTGGEGVVHAAMQSGKRAMCAGPGNPPVVVDETADIALAARGIVRGGSFDNNVICVDEKEVFVVESVADELLAAMKPHGAVVLNDCTMPADGKRGLQGAARAVGRGRGEQGADRQERGRDPQPDRDQRGGRCAAGGDGRAGEPSAGVDGADDAGHAGGARRQRGRGHRPRRRDRGRLAGTPR